VSEPIRLTTPLTQDKVRSLHIGDRVLISGTIYAARDAAHKRMVETLDRGEPLPVDLRDQIVYYVGPSPAKPGQAIGSAGPTTSGRMDAYAPRLMEKGLSGMIGKGNRSQAVKDAMQRYGTVYFAATGGAGALLSRCIRSYTVLAYAELGPEALAAMEVVDFPAIVVGDVEGGDYYMEGPKAYAKRGCQLNNDAISFQLPLTWNLAKSAIVRSTISRVLDTTIDFLLKRANQCLCLPLFCSRYTVCDLL